MTRQMTRQKPALTQPPRSAYFDKPEIDIADGEVLLFSCLKNEVQRIPYFLEYYRQKGIKHFFVIDNASTDGSREYLETQADVHLFHTEMSYKGSSAGRFWMQELCDHYGRDRWCLTADVDELLVFPGSEYLSIPQLCSYLDIEGSRGLFCVFLDMYSDKPLSDTIYEPGEPFLDVCNWYETDSYTLRPGANPPFLSVFGGPRDKSFLESHKKSWGPMMKKVPLVKWEDGFSYIFSTHSHTHIPLSRTTGALLHFKFFDFFTELAKREHKRGDRRQTQDYAHYANTMAEQVCFWGPQSRRYRDSSDLVKLGVLACPRDFRDFAVSAAKQEGPARQHEVRRAFPEQHRNDQGERLYGYNLRDIASIWPFVHNHAMLEHFADGRVSAAFTDRQRFIDQARKTVKVLDVDATGLLVRLSEAVMYRYRDPQLSLLCYSGDDLLWQVELGGHAPELSVAENSMDPGVYRLTCTWPAPDADGLLRDLAFYVIPREQIPDEGLGAQPPKAYARLLGKVILNVPALSLGDTSAETGLPRVGLDGVIEKIADGQVVGWIKDLETERWDIPAAVYLGDQFIATVHPNTKRQDLGRPGNRGRVFAAPLPLGYFYEQGRKDVVLDIRPVGRNVSLRRGPFPLDGEDTYHWDRDAGTWKAGPRPKPAAPAPEPEPAAAPVKKKGWFR